MWLAIALLLPGAIPAQATDRDSVLATVEGLFTAIANRDSALALRVTDPAGQIIGVRADNPKAVANRNYNGDWARRLAGDGPVMMERMWEPEVMIRGPLAVVWAQYDFHINGEFSHCGIDAFTLLREGGVWRIVAAVYTIEIADCKPSPLGPPASR